MFEQFGAVEGVEKIGFRVYFGQLNAFMKVASVWSLILSPYSSQEEAFVNTASIYNLI